jgi:hypothetical protein
MDIYECPLLVMINTYEKYDDMLIENPLLFIRGDACVKSSRSREVC